MSNKKKLTVPTLCLLASGLFPRRHDVPIFLARHVRTNVARMEAPTRRCEWETMKRGEWTTRIMRKFFGVEVSSKVYCDLFLIEGVPAASMLYETTTKSGTPVVTEFHINHGLVLLFDAGGTMRTQLFRRHADLRALRARNGAEFMNC